MKKTLSKKEIKELNSRIAVYGFSFSKKDFVTVEDEHYTLNDEVYFFPLKGILIPSLKIVLAEKVNLPRVVVDMGAVKFLINGADVMVQGIVETDHHINEGDIVAVVDQNNNKPLCLCKALMSSAQISETKTGKVLKNLHYVGDKMWG